MKINPLLITMILLFSLETVSAQPDGPEAPPLLAYLKAGVGLPKTGWVSGEILLRQRWSFSLFYTRSERNSSNVPVDYYQDAFATSSTAVPEQLTSFGATAGVAARLSAYTRVRLYLKTGVGFGQFNTPANFIRAAGNSYPNYDYQIVRHNATSWLLHLGFDFPIIPFYGLSVGGFAHLNKHWKVVGVDIAHNLGYFAGIRPERKKPDK